MFDRKAKKKMEKGGGGISGWMQITLSDIPADFMFDELRDMQAYAAASPDTISFELYDPTTLSTKKKKNSEEWRHAASRQKDFATVVATAAANEEGRVLAEAGHCYFQRLSLNGEIIGVRTRFTHVDKDYNEENKRSFVTCCSFLDCTVTCTYVVERLLLLPENKTSSTASTVSTETNTSSATTTTTISKSPETATVNETAYAGCRWTVSYAMLPNGLYGKFLFWRFRRQLDQDLRDLMAREFDFVPADIRARYYKRHPEKCVNHRLTGNNTAPLTAQKSLHSCCSAGKTLFGT